jgi:hypothetical protein
MRDYLRVLTFVALTGLAAESTVPLERALADSAEGQLPVAGPPAPLSSDARLLAALRSKVAIEPIASEGDPYTTRRARETPHVTAPAATVCGVRFEQDQVHYRLSTFADTGAAQAAGFAVTHFGACGTCSTLQDLAVYLERRELTAPVRRCGIRWGSSSSLTCLKQLGFTGACAQTWAYDIRNTRRQCFSVCLWSWVRGEAPTRGDGRLNACLQCDEDHSGPVFKATAGRTRRNSGIQSSIPRPIDEIAPVVHDYVPDVAPR